MNAILSIKPKYVKEIVDGRKKYEFRKKIFKQDVEKVLIYETVPRKKIVASFVVGRIINDTPTSLWKKFNKESGINRKEFFDYYKESDMGYAIEIKQLEIFETPVEPNRLKPSFTPPQSFCYID